MKNIQVIDGAENCSFSVYSISDDDFALLFPQERQELEFIEDVAERMGEEKTGMIVRNITRKRVKKQDILGIHGTLFFSLAKRKRWFPNKREDDVDRPISL